MATYLLVVVVLLFFSFLLSPAAAKPRSGCRPNCGDVEIHYPFGIGPGCYFNQFFGIDCDETVSPAKPYLSSAPNRSEVIQIHIPESQVRIKYPFLASARFSMEVSPEDIHTPNETINIEYIDLGGTPYTLSENNSVTFVGCDDFVKINGITLDVFAGCTAMCVNNQSEGSCPKNGVFGNGCCRSVIPNGTSRLNFNFTDMHEHSRKDLQRRLFPYSLAFVGVSEEGSFSYNLSSLNDTKDFRKQNRKETENNALVLDWRIGNNQSCDQAGNKSACMKNSDCKDFVAGGKVLGYRCHCKEGYDGNPYVSDDSLGCKDIDECKDNKHQCKSSLHCKNNDGGYTCFCPRGYRGDGRKDGHGCSPSILINAFIGAFSGVGFLLMLGICYWLRSLYYQRKDRRRKQKFFKRNGGILLQQQATGDVVGKTNLFNANELEKATDNFNDARVLGQGGHGTVYKGILSDGKIVAIKKARLLDENELEQFINEMVVLSQINHKNVVKLLGCCLETEVPLLVYEFVPNGTLSNLIRDSSTEFPFTWNMRLKIAIDIAGAISYLHSASSIPIYHRDIKSSNILLDEKYVVKVSDFGGSRLVPVDQTHLTTMVTGTFGYLDPEYFQSGQFTEKSDVYSFGVVLVELLTGKRPISFERANGDRSLASLFLASMEDKNIETILDDKVIQGPAEDVMAVAKLAKRCLNLKGKARPTMKAVATELENIRKPQIATVVEEDDEHQDIRGHEPKCTTLSSFDYTWTSSFNSTTASSPTANHPLIKQNK